METEFTSLAMNVSPRTRGLFIKNLTEFQTELARIQGGFVPAMSIWAHRKKLPMIVFQSMRRIQDLRVRVRELGLSLGQLHMSNGVTGRKLLDELCHAGTEADFLEVAMVLIPRLLVAAIDEYLKDNSSVYDLPSAPLLQASRDDLNSQITWAEKALVSLKQDAGQQPDFGWVEKMRTLAQELPTALHEHSNKTSTPLSASRRIGVLPFTNSVLPRGFHHLEFGPGALPTETEYPQRERYHAVNFLQEVQACDTCGSLLFEAPDMPWEFYFDVSRQLWDEARHSAFGESKLQELGSSAAEVGLSKKAYAARQTLLPADRYAALATQEADAFPGKHAGLKDSLAHGDRLSAMAWSYDIADETQHVRFGNKWVPVLLERLGDPRSFEQVKEDARNWRQSVLAEVYKPAATFFGR